MDSGQHQGSDAPASSTMAYPWDGPELILRSCVTPPFLFVEDIVHQTWASHIALTCFPATWMGFPEVAGVGNNWSQSWWQSQHISTHIFDKQGILKQN